MSFYSCICVLRPFKVNRIFLNLIVEWVIRFMHGATEWLVRYTLYDVQLISNRRDGVAVTALALHLVKFFGDIKFEL